MRHCPDGNIKCLLWKFRNTLSPTIKYELNYSRRSIFMVWNRFSVHKLVSGVLTMQLCKMQFSRPILAVVKSTKIYYGVNILMSRRCPRHNSIRKKEGRGWAFVVEYYKVLYFDQMRRTIGFSVYHNFFSNNNKKKTFSN